MNQSLITCRTCSSRSCHGYLIAEDLNQGKSNELFPYYLCNDCSSIFLHPIPSNLGFFYSRDYPAYAVKNSEDIENDFNCLEHAKLEIVRQYVPSGKLVEIGPAAGRFLSVASRAGYEVLGIEQDAECVEYIKNTLGLDVKLSNKPADELSQIEAGCDVIVAWHVIEHLQDLKGFVSAASKAISKPGGVMVVSAPNPQAWSFKIFGRFWVHLDAPRHLTLIPLEALDQLMTDQGLERIACIYDDPVGLKLNRMGWQNSLMNLSRNRSLRQPWLAVLGRIMSVAMSLFDRMSRGGAAYTVVYKKTMAGNKNPAVSNGDILLFEQ